MVKKLSVAAVIGALYAAITLLCAPISFGVLQIRASEALCAFALISPAAIPGLTVGCFLANLIGSSIVDAVLGSLATLLGTWLMYRFRARPLCGTLLNSLSNGIIVGLMLFFTSGLSADPGAPGLAAGSLPAGPLACILWVLLGELISCCLLGLPLYKYLSKHSKDLGL